MAGGVDVHRRLGGPGSTAQLEEPSFEIGPGVVGGLGVAQQGLERFGSAAARVALADLFDGSEVEDTPAFGVFEGAFEAREGNHLGEVKQVRATEVVGMPSTVETSSGCRCLLWCRSMPGRERRRLVVVTSTEDRAQRRSSRCAAALRWLSADSDPHASTAATVVRTVCPRA